MIGVPNEILSSLASNTSNASLKWLQSTSSGGEAAIAENALVYNKNVVRWAVNNVGIPRRPGEGLEIYGLFGLLIF